MTKWLKKEAKIEEGRKHFGNVDVDWGMQFGGPKSYIEVS